MIRSFALLSLCACLVPSAGALPLIYDAAAADRDPASQGWEALEVLLGTDEGGNGRISRVGSGDLRLANAGPVRFANDRWSWQIHDQIADAALNLPEYRRALTAEEQNTLMAAGWRLRVTFRAVENGNQGTAGFFGWGLSAGAEAAAGAARRVGFVLTASGDLPRVTDQAGNVAVALEPSMFHTLEAIGIPGTTTYEWSLNGRYIATLDLLDNSVGGLTDGRAAFSAHSSAQLGAIVNWAAFSLEAWTRAPAIVVDLRATGENNGTSWVDAYTDLRDALAAAQPGDEIWVAAGDYRPFTPPGRGPGAFWNLPPGVALYGGFAGHETERGQRDPDPATNRTVLFARSDPDGPSHSSARFDHIVVVEGAGPEAILDGFTLAEGDASNTALNRHSGGALKVASGASVVVRNCHFRDNRAAFSGGAVYVENATARFEHCRFLRNANGVVGWGGAVMARNAGLTLRHCWFEGNRSGAQMGGALFGWQGATVTVEDSVFVDNESAASGGAIAISNAGLSVTRSVFWGNVADASGGAISVSNPIPAQVEITHSLLAGNQANFGGAVEVWTEDPGATLLLHHSAFVGNAASLDGGALEARCDSVTARFCSFAGNRAGRTGGGFYLAGDTVAVVQASILWGNQAGSLVDTAAVVATLFTPDSPAPATFTDSIVGGSGGSASWDAAYGQDGGGNRDDDPLFSLPPEPARAPTAVGNLRLLAASPARDRGTSGITPGAFDLAGRERVVGGIVDWGAYESQADSDGDGLPDFFELIATEGTSTSAADPASDDDADGFSVLEEFAFGQTDLDADRPHQPEVSWAVAEGTGRLRLTAVLDPAALPHLHLRLARGTTLAPAEWTPVEVRHEAWTLLPGTAGLVEAVLSPAEATPLDASTFYRVQVDPRPLGSP
jgi:hypothetical protein